MIRPSITIGVVSRIGPGYLESTIGAVLGQMTEFDSLLIALLEGIESAEEAGQRIAEARSAFASELIVDVVGETSSHGFELVPSAAAARNAILERAEGDVVVFLDDNSLPGEGWLESIRAAYIDEAVEATAGALDPPPPGLEKGNRPGGRLRWTGHLVGDFSSQESAPTSLALGGNCAVRRSVALSVGGFDEGFGEGWKYEDVEFFTRLSKVGARARFLPVARVKVRTQVAPEPTSHRELIRSHMEERAVHSRSMAAIFARHEAWALILLALSHLLQSTLDVLAARLPVYAPVRTLKEIVLGIRQGVRPVAGRISGTYMGDASG